mmetsp:Transcript_94464/g.244407  ORF Transcript_94464/g.244407 Transcript_94464/m.244407 type:complete len:280 (-) Transcript_94464:35-874(-)
MADTDWEFSHINPLVMFLITWAVSTAILFPIGFAIRAMRGKGKDSDDEERRRLQSQPIDVEAAEENDQTNESFGASSTNPTASKTSKSSHAKRELKAFKSFVQKEDSTTDITVGEQTPASTHPDALSSSPLAHGASSTSAAGASSSGGGAEGGGLVEGGEGAVVGETSIDKRKQRWAERAGTVLPDDTEVKEEAKEVAAEGETAAERKSRWADRKSKAVAEEAAPDGGAVRDDTAVDEQAESKTPEEEAKPKKVKKSTKSTVSKKSKATTGQAAGSADA